jgi:hypothetical protein
MRCHGSIVIAALLLSVCTGGLAQEYEPQFEASCTVCTALLDALETGSIAASPPGDFYLADILSLMEDRLSLALHLASVAAHPLRADADELAAYADGVHKALVAYGDDPEVVRIDTIGFLLPFVRVQFPYVLDGVPLDERGDYIDAHRVFSEHFMRAEDALRLCRDALDEGRLDVALEQMQLVYASLLAALGHADRGLAPGLRTMIAVTLTGHGSVRYDQSIQPAIDRSEPGGTLSIVEYRYSESIVIQKDLSLGGASFFSPIVSAGLGVSPILEGSPTRPVVEIGATSPGDDASERISVTIGGIELRDGQYGIHVGSNVTLTLTDVAISGTEIALLVEDGAEVEIRDCRVEDSEKGLVFMSRGKHGLLGEIPAAEFSGTVTGCGNVFEGSGEYASHPEGYEFLLDACSERLDGG